ncbi:MAG: hypothetical protein R2862_12020, partial [Thermoanaerobaculia bacterium]
TAPQSPRTSRDGGSFDAPPLATRAWAAAFRIAGARGPYALDWLLFAAALLLAVRALAPTVGAATPAWVALFAFGSVTFDSVFRLSPELPVLFAVVVAASLVWWKEIPQPLPLPAPEPDGDEGERVRPPDQIYGGEPGERPLAESIWRWPLGGLALGAAAVHSPVYLVLAWPMALELPRRRRGLVALLFAIALALPVAFVAVAAEAPWQAPSGVFTPSLLGWNLLYALVGRSAGLLVHFLPVIALFGFSTRLGDGTGGRRFLPLAVIAAVVLQLLLYPFDWTGDRAVFGNPWFVPLYGALWFALDVRARARAIPWLALPAAALLLSFWTPPASVQPRAPQWAERLLRPLEGSLPVETTLRSIPGAREIRRAGARFVTLDPALGKVADQFLWQGARQATLWIAADRELSSERFELSENAPSQVDVGGGVSGSTTFRPSGGVVDVALTRPARRHPLWWSRDPASIYVVRLTPFPAPPAPIRIDPTVPASAAGEEAR